MKHLKRLGLTLTLMSVLAVASFAGQTETPPAPCAPGQTETPPCSQSLTGGSTDPGENNGPPSSALDVTTIAEGIQLALSLF